jgi:hypothetical protein
LLDYIEKAGIAAVPPVDEDAPKPRHGQGLLHRLAHVGELGSGRGKEVE